MKKILALLSIVALVACGNGSTSGEVKCDTCAVAVDTVKVDSTAALLDSSSAKLGEVK